MELMEHFRSRYRKEYMTALREHHQAMKGPFEESIKVGDIVLIEDEMEPRNHWKLAVIERIFVSADDKTRSAAVRTANGLTSRPITKLYPLEINEVSAPAQGNTTAGEVPPSTQEDITAGEVPSTQDVQHNETASGLEADISAQTATRPVRRTAQKARQLFKAIAADNIVYKAGPYC